MPGRITTYHPARSGEEDVDETHPGRGAGDRRDRSRPADLGYYVGFRIAESYFERTTDKKKAIRDILTARDYPAFLRASGYGEKFRGN